LGSFFVLNLNLNKVDKLSLNLRESTI